MDKTTVDPESEKMIFHKVETLEKARDFMILSVHTFNARLWRFCICEVSLYLHMCVGFDEFMAFDKVTNCNHVLYCTFQICVLGFLTFVCIAQDVTWIMYEVLLKHHQGTY